MKLSSFLPLFLPLAAASPAVKAFLRRPKPTIRMLHEHATKMSNGAELDINLGSPPSNSSFLLAASKSSMDLAIKGNASIGLGVPDVAYIYIIDTSDSTSDPDGNCGTTLDCVQKFFKALHEEAVENGSAELAAVINFDDNATISADLQDPGSDAIEDAISSGISDGWTNCNSALELAANLAKDSSNTTGTTIVVFAGDGLCEDSLGDQDPSAAADALGATGAIVYSIAVGDNVDCNAGNHLIDIPQNGGNCISIPDPNDPVVPDIIDKLIHTTLVSIELKLDDGDYTAINNTNISEALPAEDATSVIFDTRLEGLTQGNHTICVRASGNDSLGDSKQIEDCHQVFVQAQSESDGLNGGQIFLIVLLVLIGLGFLAYAAVRVVRAAKVSSGPGELELEQETGGKRVALPPVD